MSGTQLLQAKIDEAEGLVVNYDQAKFENWHITTRFLLGKVLPADEKERHLSEFDRYDGRLRVVSRVMDLEAEKRERGQEDLRKGKAFLDSVLQMIALEEIMPSQPVESNQPAQNDLSLPAINVQVNNNNNNVLTVDMRVSIQQIVESVQSMDVSEGDKRIATETLTELDNELKKTKKKQNWQVISKCLIWILGFSRDIFIQLLPILLQSQAN